MGMQLLRYPSNISQVRGEPVETGIHGVVASVVAVGPSDEAGVIECFDSAPLLTR